MQKLELYKSLPYNCYPVWVSKLPYHTGDQYAVVPELLIKVSLNCGGI